MKTLILCLLFTVSFSAFARTPYDSLIKLCNEVAHNGGCYVTKYDPKKFDYKKESAKFLSGLSETQIPVFTRAEILSAIQDSYAVSAEGQDEFYNKISSLMNSRKNKASFAIAPHGDNCTESEYCSFVSVRIFTTDGYILDIDLDYTT